MGNTLCQSNGASIGTCGCFDWCSNPFWAPLPIFIYRLIRLIIWSLWIVVMTIVTLVSIVVNIVSLIYPDLLWFGLFFLLAWAWWYLYPPLAPYISGIVVPLLNVAIRIFVVLWNIGLLLWNVFVGVWNGMVPLIGMLIYIAMELLVTIMNLVVKILGSINVTALFQPFVAILKILVQVVLEVLQALISAAISALMILSKIIGALVNVVMKVVQALLPIVQWVLQILFKVLQPILFIIQIIAGLFSKIAGGGGKMLRMLLAHNPRPELNDSGSRFDNLHQQAYGQAYPSASRHWGRSAYSTAKNTEQAIINDFLERNPVQSFDYYWSVNRPYLSSITYANVHPYTGTYENVYGDDPRLLYQQGAGRRLMDAAHNRGLLSVEEHDLITNPAQDMSNEAYWKLHDHHKTRNSHEHVEWYQRQYFEKHIKRQNSLQGLRRRLLDLNETLPHAELLTDAEHHAQDPRQNKKHWDGELHKKVRCQNAVCGGKGAHLPHPVHQLRDLSYKRQQQPNHELLGKSKNQTVEEFHKDRFIHMSVAIEALHAGNEKLAWHLMNPVLHKHFHDAFRRTTGYESVNHMVHDLHEEHGDFYQILHRGLSAIGDHPLLVWGRSFDPDAKTRPFYSDWIKTVEVRERREQGTGRKILTVELPSDEDHATRRRLLEDMDPESIEYADQVSQWHRETRMRLDREHRQYESHLDSTELDPDFEQTHNPGRRILSNPDLPFAPNPVPNSGDINAEAQRRQNVLQGNVKNPQSAITVFDLLTGTDCFTTTPRNPLCLFSLPASFQINNTPQIIWPENATGDDFCDYLYRPIPREAGNWRAWISPDWFFNAFQSVRIILSALSSVLTNSLGLLDKQYGQWIGWVIQPFLAFPPGYMPNGIDWVCFAIYTPYAWMLCAAIGLLFYTVVKPALALALETIVSWTVFSGLFIAQEQARQERLKETDQMFLRASKMKQMNVPHQLDPSITAVKGVPTVMDVGGRYRQSNPYSDKLPAEHIPHSHEHEDRALAALERALLEASEEMGMPHHYEMPELVRRWPFMQYVLDLLSLGSGAQVTYEHLRHFEHRYNWFLHSYQFSPLWIYQRMNYLRKQRKIALHYSPLEGPLRRGYTEHTTEPEDSDSDREEDDDEEIGEDV
jgi:hypothetical protein